MGLFELRKPKWQHKDPQVRLKSIDSIDPSEIELLADLGLKDQDKDVRYAAINRLTDLSTLSQLSKKANSEDISFISARIDSLLLEQLLNCQDIEDCRDKLNQLTSPALLKELAVKGMQPDIRLAAVNNIDDQHLLAEIAKQNCGKKPAIAAIEKISDETLLAELIEKGANKAARQLAKNKIHEMEKQRNPLSQEEITSQRLRDLVSEALTIKDDQDMDATSQRMEAIHQECHKLDSELNHPEYTKFQKIYSEFQGRYQEVLDLRKSMQDKTVRYDKLKNHLEKICETIERLSCSTSDDAQTLYNNATSDWKKLATDAKEVILLNPSLAKRFEDGCRAFVSNEEVIDHEKKLFRDIENHCAKVNDLIAKNDLKKAAILLEKVEKNLKRIEFKFLNRSVLNNLVTKLHSDLKKMEKDSLNQNISRRLEICKHLEKLYLSDNPNYINKEFQALQLSWQELPNLNNKKGEELVQRFEKAVSKLTGKLKSLEKEKDWELWANLKLKEKLTEKVVALDHEEDLESVFNEIKKAQAEWKKIGPVPQKESQKLWDTFHNGCNRNFERAIPYLEELKIRRAEATERRREICAIVSDLAESNDWQKTTQTIKELQAEWKQLLHGPQNEERKLFKQFRKSCDHFFSRRKEHNQLQDEKWQKNLSKKEKLCEEAEQLAKKPQLDHLQQYKFLQAAWKKIGPVPRKDKDQVWKRFRAACDKYFHWLNEVQLQNLQLKEGICETAEKLVAGSGSKIGQEDLDAQLADLQQQWEKIGPVPPDQRDKIWQRFKKPLDQFQKAKKEQHKKEVKQQRENTSIKEDLLAQAHDLARHVEDKDVAKKLKELQKRWEEIGLASPDKDHRLNENFQAICQAYSEGNSQYLIDLEKEQLENQKKKESLCLRLENILGLSPNSPANGDKKALSLAEELKQAMEDNFMLAGRRDEHRDINDEVKRIEQEWKNIGLVPPRMSKLLTDRFNKALTTYIKIMGNK